MKQEIYFVLDKDWQQDVYALSRERHIWICSSPSNNTQIDRVWKADNGYHPNYGITSFEIKDETLPVFYQFLGIIDDHHQEGFSNGNAWQIITVFGLDVVEVDKEKVEEVLGFRIELKVLVGCFQILKNKN